MGVDEFTMLSNCIEPLTASEQLLSIESAMTPHVTAESRKSILKRHNEIADRYKPKTIMSVEDVVRALNGKGNT